MRGTIILSTFITIRLAQADILVTATDQHKGTFRGFEKDHFVFFTENGDELRMPRSSVRVLVMEPAREVEVTRTGRKTADMETLAGYEKMKFCVIQGGRTNQVMGTAIAAIVVPEYQGQKAFGNGAADAPRAPRAFDISMLEALPDLSPERKAVLENYKEARRRFDAFVKESSALVAKMDRATGLEREKLLDVLRSRKNEEQPLKRALERATADLLAAFPDIGKSNGSVRKSDGVTAPSYQRESLMILDVSDLLSDSQLTEEQVSVAKRYQELAGEYKSAINGTVKKNDVEIEQLEKDIKKAEADLLKVFPGIQVVEQPGVSGK